MTGCSDTHRLLSVRGHLLRVDINRDRLCFEDLVLPPANLRAPLLPMHVEHAARFLRVNQYSACVPAVLDGKAIQLTQNARRAHLWEPVNSDDAHVLPSDARFDSSVEVLAGEKFIQVTRDVG